LDDWLERAGSVKNLDGIGMRPIQGAESCSSINDTKIFDEIIARSCKRSDGHDLSDDYIDEVIARSIKKSVENLLDGSLDGLDGTRYIDEVIARSCGRRPKSRLSLAPDSEGAAGNLHEPETQDVDSVEAGEVFLDERRQQICDSVVQRYLQAVKPNNRSTGSPANSQISPSNLPRPIRRMSSTKAQPETESGRPRIGNSDRKCNLVTTLVAQAKTDTDSQGQMEKGVKPPGIVREDWRKKIEDKKQENKLAQIEDQLKAVKEELSAKVAETETLERKLKIAVSARDDMEDELTKIKEGYQVIKEDMHAKDEEVRVRSSDVTRLDNEIVEKQKRLEEVSNSAIETEKKIFDFEINLKNLKAKLELAENESDAYKEEARKKSALYDEKCMENEELGRKLVVIEGENTTREKDVEDLNIKVKGLQDELDKKETEARGLKTQLELERSDSKLLQVEKMEKNVEEMRKKDFSTIKSKFESIKSENKEAKEKLDCEECPELKKTIETINENHRRSLADLDSYRENVRRVESRENERKVNIENLTDETISLKEEKKKIQNELALKEVELERMKAKVRILEDKLEEFENNAKTSKQATLEAEMAKEDIERTVKVLKLKIVKLEEQETNFDEENKKLKRESNETAITISAGDRKILQMQSDLEKCQVEVEKLKKDKQILEETVEASNESSKKMINNNNNLEEKITKLDEDNMKLRKEKKEAEFKYEELEMSCRVLKVSVDNINEELGKEKALFVDYQKKMEEELRSLVDLL